MNLLVNNKLRQFLIFKVNHRLIKGYIFTNIFIVFKFIPKIYALNKWKFKFQQFKIKKFKIYDKFPNKNKLLQLKLI